MTRRRKQNRSVPLNTADYLARAVFEDRLPDHPQTCEDYGLNRAVTVREKCYLMGLYAGLIKVQGISPKTIHEWRIRGVLADEIKAAFYKIPEGSRGGYFPWFLQNEHIVALAGKPLSTKEFRDHGDAMVLRSWRFTGGSEKDSAEEIRATIARKPAAEQSCHWLYTFLLSQSTPPPGFDLWIEFGFASCTFEEEENVLGGYYQRLITMCTFKEFCDAYRNRRLLDLLHSKGLQVNTNPHLCDLLSGTLPVGCRKSVWDLKAFVLQESPGEDLTMVSSVMVDYGFINCRNTSERQQLKKLYKDFFNNRHGDPLALHEAAIKGNLYGLLSNIVQGVQVPKFQRLTKNPYPLPGLELDIDISRRSSLSTWQAPSFLRLNTPIVVLGAGLGVVLFGIFLM